MQCACVSVSVPVYIGVLIYCCFVPHIVCVGVHVYFYMYACVYVYVYVRVGVYVCVLICSSVILMQEKEMFPITVQRAFNGEIDCMMRGMTKKQ